MIENSSSLVTLTVTEYDHGQYDTDYICSNVEVAQAIASQIRGGDKQPALIEWEQLSSGGFRSRNVTSCWSFKIAPTVIYGSVKQFRQRNNVE